MAKSLSEQISDFMSVLNPGSVFGIDIGAYSIKVCELSGGPGKFRIERFAMVQMGEAALIEDEIQKPAEVAALIIDAIKEAGINSKAVCLGLSGPNTMVKRLTVPDGSREEIEDQIFWEAEQYITFGVDESKLDFDIIGENQAGGKDVIVAAVREDVFEHFNEVIEDSGLKVKIADLNVLALNNVLEEVYASQLDVLSEGTLIIDFGAQATKILVYKDQGPIFTKEVPVGGTLITEEIQRQMGVSYEEAEDLKKTVDDNGNLPTEILEIINIQIDAQLAEIRKNINFYISTGSTDKVSSCLISGGGSLAPGVLEKMQAITGIEVYRLDPFKSLSVDEKKINYNLESIGPMAATVVGLGMRLKQ